MEDVKLWYNGYNFLSDKIYNPYDILLFLDKTEYKNYWFQTGSPSFLIKLLEERKYNTINIEHIEVSEDGLGAFDVDNIQLEVLLFQTGYLTIKKRENLYGEYIYTLTYPKSNVA
ncbi:MAG: hypothetical protein H7A25_05555 [Leptospiraceae bacterium]|nr:hypothetical protein [Leptospiraceae bacterium]MCP5499346.1 hypothetical protein [Leptospiraceae bacterium]